MSVNCYLHYVFRADHLVLDNQLCTLPGEDDSWHVLADHSSLCRLRPQGFPYMFTHCPGWDDLKVKLLMSLQVVLVSSRDGLCSVMECPESQCSKKPWQEPCSQYNVVSEVTLCHFRILLQRAENHSRKSSQILPALPPSHPHQLLAF